MRLCLYGGCIGATARIRPPHKQQRLQRILGRRQPVLQLAIATPRQPRQVAGSNQLISTQCELTARRATACKREPLLLC
jgi:hypothetical protein